MGIWTFINPWAAAREAKQRYADCQRDFISVSDRYREELDENRGLRQEVVAARQAAEHAHLALRRQVADLNNLNKSQAIELVASRNEIDRLRGVAAQLHTRLANSHQRNSEGRILPKGVNP